MGFIDLDIKNCYESGVDDIVESFYEPVLSQAVQYDRIAGFFSSSCLAIVARGASEFISNGGKMRLITSPILGKDDAAVIKKFSESPEGITAEDLKIDVDSLEDEFASNHVKAMGWLLANGLLEIKLALVHNADGSVCTKEKLNDSGLFHQKVGVLTDKEGNKISFSGSINETASAWVNNDEEFKVFKAWGETANYFKTDEARFEEIWNNQRANTTVYDLPSAVKNKLIQHSSDFDVDSISIEHYRKEKTNRFAFLDPSISLFPYQKEALYKWKCSKYKMLFEMATGTGKTRTAIAGIKHLMNINKKLFVIVATPQGTLSLQWKSEIENLGLKFNTSAVIDGTNSDWRNDLKTMLLRNKIGMSNQCIIYTTHSTSSSEDFRTIVLQNIDYKTKTLFVGDEAHWLGARELRKALLPTYYYRIALSATPSRWFDDYGTKILVDYFGNGSFEFSLHDALTNINPLTGKQFLVDYYYNISKVSLTEEEADEYCELTGRIVKLMSVCEDDPDAAEILERLLEKRANIIKNAENKYIVFSKIIDELNKSHELEDLIIFVSPQQIGRVQDILMEKGVIYHKLTEEEGTTKKSIYGDKTERQFIIEKFKEREYLALVAIKCLDEGIDIPSARRGILMASSTNPREYVQRIGRIIRQADDKPFACLYDICVESALGLYGDELEIEKKIRKKEIARLKEISNNAINRSSALLVINSLNI